MTEFYIEPNFLEKYIEQNQAECIEYVEGCLQDNGLYTAKRGFFAVYEHYVNEWTSNLKIIFSQDNNEIEKIIRDFNKTFKEIV